MTLKVQILENPSEIEVLCSKMQPCAQKLMLDLARKYVSRWPAQAPQPLRLALVPSGVKVNLDKIDNVIDGAFAVPISEPINCKKS